MFDNNSAIEYETPQIIAEGDLEIQAGSPLGIIDLTLEEMEE